MKTEIPQSSGPPKKVGDEAVHKELGDRMERAATTASSLEAEQDSGNINKTQSMATLNESFPPGTDSGSGPRCQDTILGVQKLKLAGLKVSTIRLKLVLLRLENFENSSNSLSKLIECQIVDKCKTGLEYNVVPPLYIGNFMPLKPDLSFSGLEEFVNEPIVSEPTVTKPIVETSETKANADKPKAVRKNNGALIFEDWVSDSEEEDVPQARIKKKTVKHYFAKIEFVKSKQQVKTPRKTTVKQGNQNRLNIHSPRGNQRN
ncbi:hypothetical protein Tco_0407269 [Tanacetum coccineum]